MQGRRRQTASPEDYLIIHGGRKPNRKPLTETAMCETEPLAVSSKTEPTPKPPVNRFGNRSFRTASGQPLALESVSEPLRLTNRTVLKPNRLQTETAAEPPPTKPFQTEPNRGNPALSLCSIK